MVGNGAPPGCGRHGAATDVANRFSGNSPQPVTLTSDLTTLLATFNADKTKPLALDGKVVETPTGADFSTTITDWTPGNGKGSDVDANM